MIIHGSTTDFGQAPFGKKASLYIMNNLADVVLGEYSLADWDLRSDRNLFGGELDGLASLADWDLRSDRNS